MILHLLDDEKITNSYIRNCEFLYPERNTYICFVTNINNLRYIDTSLPNVILYTNSTDFNIDLSKYRKVVIIGVAYEKIKFCNRYVKSASIDCSFVGADLYYLLACKGFRMISIETYKVNFLMSVKFILSIIKFRFLHYHSIIRFLQERVNGVYAIEVDYNLLQKLFGNLNHLKRLESFAYPIDKVLSDDMLDSFADQDSNIILCGNSASYTNNHAYVFKILKNLINSDAELIVPFGYSNTLEAYRDSIHKMGREMFMEQYKPLTKFLPLDEYNKLLKSVRIAVFGHWRQEAMGNIIPLLYLGVKVYLSIKNPLLEEFKRLGYCIYCLEEATLQSFYEKMTDEEVMNNRKIVLEFNSSDRLYRLMRQNLM